jgi:hypothetical protein
LSSFSRLEDDLCFFSDSAVRLLLDFSFIGVSADLEDRFFSSFFSFSFGVAPQVEAQALASRLTLARSFFLSFTMTGSGGGVGS